MLVRLPCIYHDVSLQSCAVKNVGVVRATETLSVFPALLGSTRYACNFISAMYPAGVSQLAAAWPATNLASKFVTLLQLHCAPVYLLLPLT